MIYANNNEKALAFGKSHLRQLAGRVRILRGEYEDLVANGVVLNGGKIPDRYKGMTLDERRQAKLDDRKAELESKEEEFRVLNEAVEDLKSLIEPRDDLDGEFIRILCRHHREEIARYTGTNPLSFVED